MANIVTITTNSSAISSAISVETATDKYTFVGFFTYYAIGKILYITGSNSILKYDLTTNTASVNGVNSLDARASVVEINKQFIK